MAASGKGVQVVFVEESGRYRCDEAALRRATGGGAAPARGLPVAVVSVAGATRGGKSFLLDFFLRYLRAPEAARRSGAWLGPDHAPLTGFGWRGGCERHTQGIHVWSEPIVVDLGPEKNNQKVAVILLDSQGSFDSSSTLRDSSTVFALATLLSSVQLYNLSQNIKEDDLHYLQLFTEYGKLAREEEVEKPFQELRFLVRDWCFAYDHPFGAEGGQQLLDKRLEIRAEQAEELREIRTHVRGAFERVGAFLMPHPGLTVAASPAFTGHLEDISPEFKEALLELVPSLLAPESLVVKRVNGQPLTLQDFAEYFKTYVEVFNSDTLPTPTTVMQATSAASLEAALNACREEYARHGKKCAGGASCVARDAVPRHHAAALQAARQAFAARRTLAAPALVAARLEALMHELDSSLASLAAANAGRIQAAAARCKADYEAAMTTDKCLNDEQLTERHDHAVAATKRAFFAEFKPEDNPSEGDDVVRGGTTEEQGDSSDGEANSDEESSREDLDSDNEDWIILEEDLRNLLPLHRERNAARVSTAQERALEAYSSHVLAALEGAPALHALALQAADAAARAAAHACLRHAWLDNAIPTQHTQLINNDVVAKFEEFVEINLDNNKREIEGSVDVYRNIVSEICNAEGGRCLHPTDLERLHWRARDHAVKLFRERRDPMGQHPTRDYHEVNLTTDIERLYKKFRDGNESRNKAAVEAAHEYYQLHIGPADLDVTSRHALISEAAVDRFKSKRRFLGMRHAQDTYLEDLNKKIESSYNWMLLKLFANVGTTVAGVLTMGAMYLGTRR